MGIEELEKRAVNEAIEQAVAAKGDQETVRKQLGLSDSALSVAKKRGTMRLRTYLQLLEMGKNAASVSAFFLIVSALPHPAEAARLQIAPGAMQTIDCAKSLICNGLYYVKSAVRKLITMATQFAFRAIGMPRAHAY